MYTLGGGIDTERGWGRAGETWSVRDELAAYGADPSWFGLGDRDTATHLVRTRMLRAGYPLSDVTAALCHRWQPGRDAAAGDRRPGRDPRRGRRPGDRATKARKAIHFQEWWIRHKAAPARALVRLDRRRRRPPCCRRSRDAIGGADVGAARAVQPGGEHRRRCWTCPARATRCAPTPAPVVGLSPDRGRAAAARHGRRLPGRDRRGDHAREAVGRHYGARGRPAACSTAGWCTPATPPTCPASRSARCRC